MERAVASASWECYLFYVVLENGESLEPNVAAVKQHPGCRCIGVPPGTSLSDVVAKLRNKVGRAHISGLHNVELCWLELEPELMGYACTAGDVFYFKCVISPDPIDHSKAWACAVLQPFAYSVLEVEGLRRAMLEPLPLPFPVGDATYKEHFSADRGFVPYSKYPAESIASLVTTFIRSRAEMGKSENSCQSVWDLAFYNFWAELLTLAGITVVEFDRNVTDISGATAARTRPDLLLWILNRLCAKFEEKKLSIEGAYEDLVSKLSNLEAQYYGPVNWIIGVALAGDRLAAWAMKQGQVPESLGPPLKMSSVQDKAACLRFSVNLLRVALSLRTVYEALGYLPRPYRVLPPVRYGKLEQVTRRLWIVESRVVKEICPWSEHVGEGFTKLEFVKKAHELHAPGLISGDVKLRRDVYKVTMEVGYQQTVDSEVELMLCVKDLLIGLKALHAAGLVHRDVRWKNVVRIPGGGFVLIDLETVWCCGDEPLSPDLRDWDEGTLVDGKFTQSSDLQLLGKLMSSVRSLSQQATSFQLKLLGHRFENADQSLQELDAIAGR